MFQIKHTRKNKNRYLVDEMNSLLIEIDQMINDKKYNDALIASMNLRRIVIDHFSYYHIYRAIIFKRVGYLYFINGINDQGKKELIKAKKILEKYQPEYSIDLFEVNHYLYKISTINREKEDMFYYGKLLLNDLSINLMLMIRIYIDFSNICLFNKKSQLKKANQYLKKAKYLLETHNLINGIEYAEILHLLAYYYKEMKEFDISMQFISEFNTYFSHNELPFKKSYNLKRSISYLEKVINKEHDVQNQTTIENIDLFFLDDDRVH